MSTAGMRKPQARSQASALLRSRCYRYGDADLSGDRGVDVGRHLVGAEGDEQGVTDRQVGTVLAVVLLPPAANRSDPDVAAIGEFGAGAGPDVGMQRAGVAEPAADVPAVVGAGIRLWRVVAFLSGSRVDPASLCSTDSAPRSTTA